MYVETFSNDATPVAQELTHADLCNSLLVCAESTNALACAAYHAVMLAIIAMIWLQTTNPSRVRCTCLRELPESDRKGVRKGGV